MKLLLALASLVSANADAQSSSRAAPSPAPEVRQVAPQLATYTTDVLFGENWKREALSPRDRSLVTLSVLQSSGATAQMRSHVALALDNGVTPEEISGLITHLAFYAGWPRAMSAVEVTSKVFTERGVSPIWETELASYDEVGDRARASMVRERVSNTAPALAEYTNGILFQDLWQRTDLSPRDRSLVTIAGLIAMGQADQLPFHLNRAMDNGLTQAQAGEVITHSAFYAGWPRAMSAVPVAKQVFDDRDE